MTFQELLAGAYEETNYQSSPATAVVNRFKRYVNEAQRVILAEPGLSRLVDSDSPATFASVTSQARYVLPESVARIRSIRETTNDRTLSAMDLGEYRWREPDPTSVTGVPVAYVPIGRVAVAVQP